MITYNNGLKAKGSGYVMDIPDGFVIQNASDRDFIAYKDCSGEYFESDIIIYAAQQISTGEMKFKTVAEFCSVAEAICRAMPAAFGGAELTLYERKDLPGAFLCLDDCVHVHLYVGIDDHLQQMRVQFNNANRQNKAKYQKMAVEIFDHMRPDKPVELLEELDAKKYISMSDGSKDMSEWIKLVQEYAEHIGIVRNIQQIAISSAFNENSDISQLKKDIRKMLKGISALVDEELVKAEAIYTLKRAKYPNSPSVRKMKAAVKSLIDLASQSASVLGENIAVRSSFASAVNARLEKPVSAVIDTICSDAVLSDSDVKNALLQAKTKAAKAPADKSGQAKKRVTKNLKLLPLNLFDVLETVCKSQRIKAEDIQDQLKLSSAAKTSMMLNRLVEEAYLSKEFEQGTCYYTPTEDAYALLSDERQHWSAKLESNKEFALSCLERVDEYKKRVDAAVAEREEQIKSEALQRLEILESKKAACEKKLETLGLFSFSEKRSTKEEIVGLQAEIKTENEALSSTLSSLKQKGSNTVDTYRCEVEEFLKKRYNLGNKKHMIKAADYKNLLFPNSGTDIHTGIQLTNISLLSEIISLMRSGEKYQNKDIAVLADISTTQRTSALMRKLCEMGYVTSSTDRGVTYFMVNDQAVEAEIYKQFEEKLTREHSPYARYADNPEFAHLQCPEIPKVTI